MSKARNTGLDHMSDDAELVSFIDSDDYIAVSALAHLTKAMEEEQSDMAISTIIGVENTKQGRKCTPIPFKHITAGSYTKEEIIKRSLSSGGHTYRMATHKLYRRSLFQEIRFKEGKIHEDEWIAYKLLLSCERISLVDDAEYYYRYRSNSIMDQPYSEKNLQMVKAHIHNANLLIDEGYTEEAKLFLPRIVLEYCRACYKLKKHYPDIATSSRNVIKRVKDAHMLSRTEGIAYRISLRYPRFFYLLLKTSKSIINKIR